MARIAESELILNARGAIYHLNLKPDEIANTIILVGDPERVKEVSKHFDKIEHHLQFREFITHTGLLGGKRLTVMSTGIGTDNIDIALNELDALVNIDFESREIKKKISPVNFIRIGTCGGLQPDIPVDSLIASTHGLGIDNLLNFYRIEQNVEEKELLHSFVTHTQMHGPIGNPYLSGATGSLLKHFVKDFHQGITVTCPGFYGPQGRILRLGISNPELINRLTQFRFGQHRIVNFEMETSAIYGLGKLLGHHCLSLNVVIANRVRKEFSKDGKAAVHHLIIKALEIISENILSK
ncbi:MAG TPA: nucleoside phosphorylase [Chitinophagaceae bacterium]|nr:nucleoside phosphorylase [Chitinophagaceae bacterium]